MYTYKKYDKYGIKLLTFDALSQAGGIKHCFTTRRGGVSNGYCESLNFSKTRDFDDRNVNENARRLAESLDVDYNKEIQTEVIKPYKGENVTISKYYYNSKDDETRQQQSLIKYENIYMPNTGILYSSDKEFEILTILDGKVTLVKEDDILGNIIEIEHQNNIVTIYQSVKDVKVKQGDIIKQGDVIAMSGSNKLENEKENCLHFEVYKEGTLINPETIIGENE
jgi:stage II sporulation protein Q